MSELARHFGETIDGEQDGQEEPPERDVGEELTVQDIKNIVSPDYLKAVSRASGRFSFVIDSSLGSGDPMGMTNMKTRQISLNPHAIRGRSREALEGLLSHEAGHHAPEVKRLDDRMVADLGREDIIPEELAENPQDKANILRAVNGHLNNSELDCWGESFMGRGQHHRQRLAFEALYGDVGERANLIQFPLPEQLCQVLVGEDRYPPGMSDRERTARIKEIVDPEVFRVYQSLKRGGAVETLNDNRAFANYFATDIAKDGALDRKFLAHQQAFVPAWLELYQIELEKRKQQKEMQGQGGKGGKSDKGEGKQSGHGEGGGEPGEMQPGTGQGEGSQLTPEQIAQLIKQLSDELEKLGEKYKSQTTAPGEGDKAKGIITKVGEGKEAKPEGKPDQGKPRDDLARGAEQMLREFDKARRKGMAEGMGIRIESIRMWEDIKKERQQEINDAAAVIADVFLEDRRKKMVYGMREGEITPGLEVEYVSAVLSGDVSPKTHMKQKQHPDFLETEIEFIQDGSGSMSGEPIRKCVELQIILAEAFKKVRETLAAEQLLDPREEQPLRIGSTKFETKAKRIKKLEEPMNDEMEMKLIDELTKGGGGTDEEEALETVYGELTLHQKNILKIMVILTDGEGNKEAVQRIMQQIEDDKEVVVAVVGLGSGAKSVISAYTAGLREGDESNIHAFEEEDPADMLPDLLEFLKQQVQARRRYMS
ncbi:MAG: VWA domain-containing protein [Parcubacteria group bacterium]